MPTIKQLPTATSVSASDLLPVSQGGTTRGLSVGGLLSSTQAALSLVPGKLLGRVSAVAGGPEPVDLGVGLVIASGAVVATGSDHLQLPVSPGLSAGDEVVVNSGGAAKRMAATLLRGLFTGGAGVTIDGGGTISATGSSAPATASRLGGVKVGAGLSVASDGTLTPDGGVVALRSGLAGVALSGAYGDLSGRPALGGAAALSVGTVAGTVAAGDDPRIVGALSGATAAATYAPLSRAPSVADAGATGSSIAVSLLYEQSAWPITAEGGIWSNSPYAYFGISRDFAIGVGGPTSGAGPVATLFAFANATGSASDVVGVIGDAVARVNGGTVFGANFIARATDGVTGVKLVGLELDVEPTPTGSVTAGGGLFINAFSQRMPIPAMQIGGLGGGTFANGLEIGGVDGAGVAAVIGTTMSSLTNASVGTFSDSAHVLGNTQQIRFGGTDGTSGRIFAASDNFFYFVPPTGGFAFRDPTNTANLLLLESGAVYIPTPVPPATDSSQKAATTAFVQSAVASGIAAAASGTVVTGGTNYPMAPGDRTVIVRKSVGSATAVTLPASPVIWATYAIKDGKGDAGTNPITVTPSAGQIDGSPTFVLNVSRGAITTVWDGSAWSIV